MLLILYLRLFQAAGRRGLLTVAGVREQQQSPISLAEVVVAVVVLGLLLQVLAA